MQLAVRWLAFRPRAFEREGALLDPGIDLSPVGKGWRGFFKWMLSPIPAGS
jgi:hypothetical protein